MSRESKLAKNTLILSIGTFLPRLASFITLPILTGYLTKEEMGTYDLITILESLLLPTVTLQIQAAAFRFLIDVRDDEEKVKEIVTNIVVFVIPTSLLSLIILFFCLGGTGSTIRMLICLYFLFDVLGNVARQICRGLNENLEYSISAILAAMGKMVFAVICVYWLKAGLRGTVTALLMSAVFSFVYLLFRAGILRYVDLRYYSKDKIMEMLRYSWPMVPNSMSAWVMRVSDRLVVTFFMGVAANAVYAVANKIPGLLTIAQNTFTMAWQENASVVSRDRDAGEYYSSMFRVMFDLMAGFFGLLIAATPILFKLLIRGDYAAAYNQIPILFVAMFFYSMSTFLGGIYVAYKESRSVGVTTTAAAACNLIVDIAAIRWIGLYAASGSTLISYLFLFIFRSIDVQRMVKVTYKLRHMLVILSIMVLQSVLCFQRNFALNIINLIIGCAVFFAINRSFVRALLRKGTAYLNKKRAAGAVPAPADGHEESGFPDGEQSEETPSTERDCSADEAEAEKESSRPVLCADRTSCCGCSACSAVCPAGAIHMEQDEEGFLYPNIDRNKCIGCLLCEKVCAFKADSEAGAYLSDGAAALEAEQKGFPGVFAAKFSDDGERMKSQSGGAFAALSEYMLEQGGVVYGCAFDENFRAVHIRAESAQERDRLRYSKYVQSDMGDILAKVEKDLLEGKKVLFSGTSCQSAGLKRFLQQRGNPHAENLYCADIVCHGVPSPLVWSDYLNWESQKAGSEPEEVLCRNKKRYGWKSHVVSIRFKNGKKVNSLVFPRLFYGHRIIRPACYKCPYKSIHHPGDITIADFWADEQAVPGFRDEKGVSLILTNNERAARYLKECEQYLVLREAALEECMQKPLQSPYDPPADRAEFWKRYFEGDFKKIAVLYTDYRWKHRLKWWIKERILDLKGRS